MTFVGWRAIRAVVLAGIVGLIALGVDACADGPLRAGQAGKYFTISDADVQVRLNDDASLSVIENLTFDFHGDFSGAYRDIPLQEGAKITHVRLSEPGEVYEPGGNTALGSFDLPGSFGTTPLPGSFDSLGGLRVVWHYDASDEKRTFTIAYKVEGAATVYEDVVDVGWFVWGDQWDFWLDRLTARIDAESGAGPTEAWVEPRRRGVEPEIGAGAETEILDLPQGEPTLLRAVFPRDAVSSVEGGLVRSGEGLGSILAEEQQLDDEYSVFEKAENFIADNVILVSALWTALVLLVAAFLYWRGRDRPTDVGEHLAEPPEDLPPALAYAYATEGDYDNKVVLATLLRLIDRGYYDSKATSGDDEEDLDLEISVPAARPEGEQLANYEVATVDFFDKLLRDKTVPLGKLKDEIPQHSATWRSRWEDLNDSLDKAEEGRLGWELDLTGARAALLLVAILGYAAIAILYYLRTHDYVIPLTAAALGVFGIYALPASWLKRLDADSRRRNAEWAAFRQWTEDFPRLEDDPPATLKLWRDILPYAVAFGTAEKVLESGRIPDSVFAEATAGGATWVYVGSHSSFSNDMNGFSGGFSSQVAPQQSSSSGGGFSGGGGGGFSGGGGGGAW